MAIELSHVKKHYAVRMRGLLTWRKSLLKAVDDVSFKIQSGESVALIGESGCGKTTLAKLILNLISPTAGTIYFHGKDILNLSGTDYAEYRCSVQAVFQNPYASLNPRMRARDIVLEPIVANRLMSRKEAWARVCESLSQVGLGEESASLYPHEFSGGQRQRIAIARALAPKPQFMILDEPVSSLDVSIRAQILNLLKSLQENQRVAYLLITHDLATAVYLSHRIEIIYSGQIVEHLDADELIDGAAHPYTRALLEAASLTGLREQTEQYILSEEVADPMKPPPGCRFHPRCPERINICFRDEPPLRRIKNGHAVRCHLLCSV